MEGNISHNNKKIHGLKNALKLLYGMPFQKHSSLAAIEKVCLILMK